MKTDGRQHIWLPEAGNTHSIVLAAQNKTSQNKGTPRGAEIAGYLSSMPTVPVSSLSVA